jgi:hypothetical protein
MKNNHLKSIHSLLMSSSYFSGLQKYSHAIPGFLVSQSQQRQHEQYFQCKFTPKVTNSFRLSTNDLESPLPLLLCPEGS